jgi:predicted ArsR family transcriptional regulator
MDTLESDSSTRDRIVHLVVEEGPVSVLELARDLHLTTAGVRRHIAALEEAGQVVVHTSPAAGAPGRGRPARRYVATVRAQSALDCTYAELAGKALAYLAEVAGHEASERFAERRADELAESLAPQVNPGEGLRERTSLLAEALSGQGYAASVRAVPGGQAIQLCQGHCPVRDVAASNPALCEAETRMFSRVLGVHVQRLSTLAAGGHVCTTHIPVRVPAPGTTGRVRAAVAARQTDRTTSHRRTATVEGDR